jgi:mannose-6-phosphate isomerase-like protein (cupin superfamily)
MIHLIEGGWFLFNQLTEADLNIEELLTSNYIFEEDLVKIIRDGVSRPARNFSDVLCREKTILKIEGYEKLSPFLFSVCRDISLVTGHEGPVTCHMFKSQSGAISFSLHEDPDDVIIYMVKGNKTFNTSTGSILVKEKQTLLIPRGDLHQGVNTEDTIMLSFGLEQFLIRKI